MYNENKIKPNKANAPFNPVKKSPCYFEAFGTIGKIVAFVAKNKDGVTTTRTMMLGECPDDMRKAVGYDSDYKTHGSYEKKDGAYVRSDCDDSCCKHRKGFL